MGGAEGAADNLEQTQPRAEPHSGSISRLELKSKAGPSTDGARARCPRPFLPKCNLEHTSRTTAFSHCAHQPHSKLGTHISHRDDSGGHPDSSLCPAPCPRSLFSTQEPGNLLELKSTHAAAQHLQWLPTSLQVKNQLYCPQHWLILCQLGHGVPRPLVRQRLGCVCGGASR